MFLGVFVSVVAYRQPTSAREGGSGEARPAAWDPAAGAAARRRGAHAARKHVGERAATRACGAREQPGAVAGGPAVRRLAQEQRPRRGSPRAAGPQGPGGS